MNHIMALQIRNLSIILVIFSFKISTEIDKTNNTHLEDNGNHVTVYAVANFKSCSCELKMVKLS